VNEDVAAADFAQEDAFGGVIEQADQVPGQVALAPEKAAQDEVLDNGRTTKNQYGSVKKNNGLLERFGWLWPLAVFVSFQFEL
jgi:hypothetical protein